MGQVYLIVVNGKDLIVVMLSEIHLLDQISKCYLVSQLFYAYTFEHNGRLNSPSIFSL